MFKLVENVKMAELFGHKDGLGQSLRVGDSVLVNEIPVTLLDGLPSEDQLAITAQKGKTLTLAGFDEHGFAELDFIDADDNPHTIWIAPTALEKLVLTGKDSDSN